MKQILLTINARVNRVITIEIILKLFTVQVVNVMEDFDMTGLKMRMIRTMIMTSLAMPEIAYQVEPMGCEIDRLMLPRSNSFRIIRS